MAVKEKERETADITKQCLPMRIKQVMFAVDRFWEQFKPKWGSPGDLIAIGGYAFADIVVGGYAEKGALTLYVKNKVNVDDWPQEICNENWSVHLAVSRANRLIPQRNFEVRSCTVRVADVSYCHLKRFLGLSIQRCIYSPVDGFCCDQHFLEDYLSKTVRVVGSDYPVMNIVNADWLKSSGYSVNDTALERLTVDFLTELKELNVNPASIWSGTAEGTSPEFMQKYGYSPLYLLRRMTSGTRKFLRDVTPKGA